MSEARLNEASRLHRDGKHDAAERLYLDVLRENPRHYGALYRLGFLCGQRGRFEDAQRFMGEAASADPVAVAPPFMRGSALLKLGRMEEAAASLSRALELKPDFPEALLNRASALFQLKRYAEAEADYDRLLTLDPDYPYARGNRLACRLYSCDWRSFGNEVSAVTAGLREGRRVIAPFDGKAIGLSPQDELRCAQIWAADQAPASPRPVDGVRPYRHARIRVAYLAAQFGDDPVSALLAGIVEHHDRTKIETTGVTFGTAQGDTIAPRFRGAFERTLECGKHSDAEIASLLRNQEIDIAVDLMGFTERCRPGILALRPAPMQVSYLGFAGTMGSPCLDYILADDIVIPAGSERHYAEKVVRLPGSFICAEPRRDSFARGPARAEAGLPEHAFVFASFNNSYKFSPAMFDVWMRLLRAVKGSVLWLPNGNTPARRNLAREAEARGVASGRLIFAPFLPDHDDHIARLGLADLFLDTYPYNAHSTAVDALRAGLPLLTRMGENFASRVAASLLHAVGLPELIVQSSTDYEALAQKLATDRAALASIREKLAKSRIGSPLFDATGFARRLESAYVTMWQRHERGLAPESFAVEAAA